MTRRIRRFIFYIFFLLFIVLAYGIILYAQGYSFDWQKKSLAISGAFYFKSYPKEADVYINGEYRGKTNQFIKRLAPKEYDVKLFKSGYYSWQKKLKIESKLVTEAKNILLVRKDPLINLAADYKINRFSFSRNNKKMIYSTEPQAALRLKDFSNNTDMQIYPIGGVVLLPEINEINNFYWSHDDEKILISFSKNRHYILSLKSQPKIEIIDINSLIKTLSGYNVGNLSFHPQDSKKVYLYSRNNLYSIEINSSKPYNSLVFPLPIITDILNYTIDDDGILYIKSTGEFYKTNFDGSSFKKIFDIPFFNAEQSISILNSEMLIIDRALYLFNSHTQVLEEVAENIEAVNFSANKEALIWQTKNKLGVIWLKPDFEQPLRDKYQTEVIVEYRQEINSAAWHPRTVKHIIFALGREIKIVELDSRDKRNIADIFIANNEHPEIFYNKWNGKLYLLDKNQLFEIDI